MSQKYPHRVMTQYRHLWSPTSNHKTPPRHTLFKPFRNPPVICGHVSNGRFLHRPHKLDPTLFQPNRHRLRLFISQNKLTSKTNIHHHSIPTRVEP
ncbi:hypothetical protein HanXRQr2_Chr02g0060721 [Helianthus annuus]|uniref:Uncharacterized protein n=1 Tax=Helianthus annuus TaxID=4232 RepID=A0A251VFM4_HELAN|nr:hypothetical protein HanXRQr2_Chr02g0060721 [Helianthus annuus]KAJ0951424.1 hypothetical protein HanPSC8_Chr02g0059811 [Helianthus annuus]